MVLDYQVLGDVRRDNAVLATIDSGQRISRLLFDCGNDVLSGLGVADIQSIDHVLFSHYHMDHISGFDMFFRLTFSRYTRENHIWGPPDTSQVMHHRFQGFLWNWAEWSRSQWFANDIYPDKVDTYTYYGKEAFANKYPHSTTPTTGHIIETPDYTVEALTLNHGTPSTGYILRETSRVNVDVEALKAMGLAGGGWIRDMKDMSVSDDAEVVIGDASYKVGELRDKLLVESYGDSLAYLTDFLMDEATQALLIDKLDGVTTLICESQYNGEDIALAQKNYHLTATQVAQVAKQATVGKLILIHVSERYQLLELQNMLTEAQAIFPATDFPPHWQLDAEVIS